MFSETWMLYNFLQPGLRSHVASFLQSLLSDISSHWPSRLKGRWLRSPLFYGWHVRGFATTFSNCFSKVWFSSVGSSWESVLGEGESLSRGRIRQVHLGTVKRIHVPRVGDWPGEISKIKERTWTGWVLVNGSSLCSIDNWSLNCFAYISLKEFRNMHF